MLKTIKKGSVKMPKCPICEKELKMKKEIDTHDEHITNQIGICKQCDIYYLVSTCNICDSESITKY